MERLTKISEIGNAYYPKCFEEPCCGMGKCIDNNCNLVNEVCNKLAEYEELEERLHKIFGEESTFSLADVIDTLEMKLSEPDKKHPVNARILTYEEADKWEEYKNLEEQGLLARLPCKEAYSASGDMVYLIFEEEIVECVHCGLEICPVSGEGFISLATDEHIFPYRNPDPEHDLDPTDWCTNVTDVSVNEIGKTLFFTREEAEKKLEKLKNEI